MNNVQKESLRKQIKKLQRNKELVEREINQASKELEDLTKQEDLEANYVKVVCVSCNGTSIYAKMGSDNTDWDEYPCDDCGGEGFLYARKFEGKRFYKEEELIHNQVYPV